MVRRKGLWTAICVFAAALVAGGFWAQHASGASDSSPTETAQQLLSAADVHGGLIVHLGCGDGQLTAALHADDGYLVLGLDVDAERIAKARRSVQSLGLYGPVTIDRWDGRHIPLVDDCVNLLVVEDAGSADSNELMRVVRPEGVLFKKGADGRWQKQVKPPQPGTDEWTHYLHDASNNAVAHDTVVGPPRHLQWVGSPRYSRHHDRMSSVSAVVSSGGRVFMIVDEASPISVLNPPKWRLVARDAYNGTVLWKRKIPKWFTHLWPLKSGPAQLPRRLVAVGDRVYVTLGIDAPLSVLDAVTGKTIRTYEGTKVTEEVIFSDGVLFALVNARPEESDIDGWKRFGRGYQAVAWDGQPRQLMAIEAETGKVRWSKKQTVLPGTLAADGIRLVFHDGERVVSLNPKTGDVLWQSDPVPRAKEIRTFYLPTLLLYENVVLFSGGETAGLQTGSWYETGKDTLTALSADTGKRLWKSYHPPSGYRSPEDTLVAGGLVWLGETTSGRAKGVFRGLDPHTGEVKVQFAPDVETYWFHHRCYRSKATDRYLLVSRTGTEFVDFRNKHWDINHWVRGACLYGVMPANGLLYAPQHPCACYLEAKLVGFNALSASRPSSKPAQLTPAERLERGPAYDNIETVNRQPSAPKPRPSADWPTYRHDPARSGRATTKIPTSLRTAWQAKIGGRLTSPVIANGRVFVASIDTHTLHVLDMDTGKPLWQFTAGGRIDSPPTVFEGLVLFGSADGYVYALRASDGAMAWRFLAAPADQRLVAFEQLESAWPVPGNVLVYDGVVYCVAGRSMFLDGGMRLWRLDAKTGRVLSETVLDDRDRQANKDLQSYVSWLNMPPALPDVLSCDGRYVYMRSQPFHLDGTRPPLKPMPRRSDADRGAPPPIQHQQYAHLFSPTGFLDDTGWHRTYWLYGSTFVSGWSGYYLAGRAAPAGRILVFDDTHVYGFGRKPKYYRWTTPIEHQLFATTKTLPRLTDTGDSERRISVVRVEKSKSLNPAGKAITVEAWVNSHQPNGVIVARGGTVHGYALYVKDGRPHFAIRADSKVAVVAAKKKITGWWSHVAGVLTQQKQLRLYVDGELVAQGRATSLIPHDPQEGLTVGMDEQSTVGDYGSPFGLDGMIDELRIYHRALSQTEIAQHAAGGKADTTDLVLYFSFDSNKAKDESGNGNDGTIERARPVRGKVGRAFRFVGQALPAPGYVVEHHWTETVPMFVRAMVLADGTLFIAGPPDVVDEEKAFRRIRDPEVQKQLAEQAEAYAGKKGGLLWAVSAKGGQKLGELRLPAPPVFDGLAAAQKRLFLSTMDGQVLCLSGN